MLKLSAKTIPLALILLIGLFAMAARPVTDPDVWWHLRTGEIITHTHHILHADPYSFTQAGKLWVDHEWLSQVFIYVVYRYAGFAGLTITFAALVAAAFFLLFLRCAGNSYLAALLTVWGAAASASTWGVRPQIFSLLLASAFLLILEKSSKRPRLLWWLPLLTLCWVNLHGAYAVGIGFIATYLVGTLLDVILANDSWRSVAIRARQLCIVLAVCLAVVSLNPNGFRMYSYPWQTVSSNTITEYIQEWASPDFHRAMYAPLLLLILALIAAIAFSRRRIQMPNLLLLIVTLYACLRSVKHIPFFVLVAVPILSTFIAAFWQRSSLQQSSLEQSSVQQTGESSFKIVMNGVLVLCMLLFAIWRINYLARHQSELEARSFPSAALSFLKIASPPAPLMNHYNWGGYLIWNLYPQYLVYVDGRSDLYGDIFLNNLADIYYLRHDWQAKFSAYPVCTVMLPPDAPLLTALRVESEWKVIYTDKQAIVLTRTNPSSVCYKVH